MRTGTRDISGKNPCPALHEIKVVTYLITGELKKIFPSLFHPINSILSPKMGMKSYLCITIYPTTPNDAFTHISLEFIRILVLKRLNSTYGTKGIWWRAEMNTLKSGSRPTEKILVTLETKQELILLKQPSERFGDVVARLIQERKRADYLSFLKNRANTGEFVSLDNDEEYKQIREKVRNTEARD